MRATGLLLLLASLVLAGCNNDKTTNDATPPPAKEDGKTTAGDKPVVEKTPPVDPNVKVGIKDIEKGVGPDAQIGDGVWLVYTGKLKDGHVFDTNVNQPDQTLHVAIGVGNVIKGWDLGLPGIRRGGKRILTIPAALAYGDKGLPPAIPPKADLTFEMECFFVVKTGQENLFDREELQAGTGPVVTEKSTVTIAYTLKSLRGKVIQASTKPITFKIEGSSEPKILSQGIMGKKMGSKVRLYIPPTGLAELAATITAIQQGVPLVMDVDLITVK